MDGKLEKAVGVTARVEMEGLNAGRVAAIL
jgi:hypothetical protein